MGDDRHVWIRWEPDEMGGMYVCGDEDGEFARAFSHWDILPYVEQLIHGPGTVREEGLACG